MVVKPQLRTTELPDEVRDAADIAPLDLLPGSSWLILSGDGAIYRLNANSVDWSHVGKTTFVEAAQPLADQEERARIRYRFPKATRHFHASAEGRFAGVVNDHGRYGEVIDLVSGRVTMTIDGGDYHPETVPLSFAFARHDGRTVVIHRTKWNRLDVSDPRTGELLTPRESPSADPRGDHYLDYFHGALYVQPENEYVLDDGWIWHPLGVPTVWSLSRWVRENAWESEDGPTKRDVCPRDSYWNHGMCWLDSKRLAIGGIGDDDVEMVEGVRIFDVTSLEPSRSDQWGGLYAKELATVPGPAGRFFSDGRRLFASGEQGLSVWDLTAGKQLGVVEGFRPTRHHRGARELVELADHKIVRLATDSVAG
jgi:hypothetical protein